MANLRERLRGVFGRIGDPAPRATGESVPSLIARDSFADDNNEFALAMYSQLRRGHGNLFCSPFGIRTALAMVYAGARTATAEEMCEILRFPPEGERFHLAIGKVIERLNAAGGGASDVSVASSLWAPDREAPLPGFLALIARYYGGTLNLVDFAGAADVARGRINEWVERRTRNRIRDLVPPGALDGMASRPTRLVVVNAVYFKGAWRIAFDESDTREEPFYVEGGRTSHVPLMVRQKPIWYAQADGYQAVDLAYRDSDVSMLVLLPDRRDGLKDLERALSVEMLNDCTARLEEIIVKLFLPRFRMTWGAVDLSDELASLGLRLLFDPSRCDLSGMNGHRPPSDKALFVSRALHKAFVEVNEQGTEAAAATATALVMREGGLPRFRPGPIPVVRADHPFLFALRDRASGVILFLGRVADPTLG